MKRFMDFRFLVVGLGIEYFYYLNVFELVVEILGIGFVFKYK